MSFFDDLNKFAQSLLKEVKPKEIIKLKSCKSCYFYQKGFCRQTSPPTKILSVYYAQGCIYFSTEQVTTGIITATERASASSMLDRIKLIDEVSLINAIALITTIQTIENVESIDLIDEITKIGEITTIRDLAHVPKSFFVNPFFYQGFAGWNKSGSVTVVEDNNERYVLYFLGAQQSSVTQDLPIPLGVDWLSEFYFKLKSGSESTNLIQILYYYTDGTNSSEIFQVTSGAWEKKTLSPTAGKYIEMLKINHDANYSVCYVGWLTTVF